MDNNELEALLYDIESDRVERNASISGKKKIHQAICAFANDMPDHRKPGVLFIGVHDDGECANIELTDELLLQLAHFRDDGTILPIPTMKVQKHVIDDCELAVVIVDPSIAPPVRYRGRVWIRVGPRRAIASAQEERRLMEKRQSRDLPYDIRPLQLATLDDLDLDHFKNVYLPSALSQEILERNDRDIEQQLVSLRFAQFLGDGPTNTVSPTVLGVLVTGRDPQALISGAYVQFLSIDGVELTAPIANRKELTGPLNDLLRMLDELLKLNISMSTNITDGIRESRHPDYPIEALRQLTRNAILHRDYASSNAPVRIYWFDDRIEIHSPGGPYGQVNAENFGQPGITDYRNPHLAAAMRNLGYVQKFGVGLQLAKGSLAENGNPPPEFIVEETNVVVIVRRDA